MISSNQRSYTKKALKLASGTLTAIKIQGEVAKFAIQRAGNDI